MKLEVELNDKIKSGMKKNFVFDAVEKAIKGSRSKFLEEKNISVSVAVVNAEEIRRLNRIYRKKDAVTDILSFSEHKSKAEFEAMGDRNIFLGELILCYNEIERYAREKNINLEKELTTVIAHGALHLLGFSHGRAMFGIQNKLWTE